MVQRYVLKTELENLTDEAINFIKSNCPNNRELFVGFSGGKDSIVIDKLMQLSGLKYKLYYSYTGMDYPEVVKFIKKHYPNCIFLKPKKSFWHSITTQNPPLSSARWCCTELKKKPSWGLLYNHKFFGIRAEESRVRSRYKQINFFEKNKKRGMREHTQYYPILNWLEYHIWEFIDYYQLPYPSTYDDGFPKTGCIVCIYNSTNKGKGHRIYKERWPIYFKLFEKQVTKWFYKRLKQGKSMAYNSPEEFLKAWYIGKAKWYSKKPKKITIKKRKE